MLSGKPESRSKLSVPTFTTCDKMSSLASADFPWVGAEDLGTQALSQGCAPFFDGWAGSSLSNPAGAP